MGTTPLAELTVPVLTTSVSERSGTTITSYRTALSVSPYCETPTTISSADMHSLAGDEPIIAIMGPTGAGKSTFVKVATGSEDVRIGNGLRSCTQRIQAVRCHNPQRQRDIIFVDTPGFDDTSKSDVDILEEIADWLQETYRAGVKLSGILYLHRITDKRMTNTLIRNLDMFQNLCGNDALSNVSFVTTHWDQLKDINVGVRNEEELRNKYWSTFLLGGSTMYRFEYTCSSAWNIINSLPMERRAMQIQKEMVDQHKSLWETAAGRSLFSWFHRAIQTLKDLIRNLEELIQKVTNVDSPEKKKSEKDLKRAQKGLKELEKQNSRLFKRNSSTNSVRSSQGSTSGDSNSSDSTWRYVVHKIYDRPERNNERRPRHRQTLSAWSESTEASSPECGPSAPCNTSETNSDSSSISESLTDTIQRLVLARTFAINRAIPGLKDAVEAALRISESLSEIPDAHHSLVSLINDTGHFLGTIDDQNWHRQGCHDDTVEGMEKIHRRLAKIEKIVKRLKNKQCSLRLSDQHVIDECREAIALQNTYISDRCSV